VVAVDELTTVDVLVVAVVMVCVVVTVVVVTVVVLVEVEVVLFDVAVVVVSLEVVVMVDIVVVVVPAGRVLPHQVPQRSSLGSGPTSAAAYAWIVQKVRSSVGSTRVALKSPQRTVPEPKSFS
jgi:hypothetical protein